MILRPLVLAGALLLAACGAPTVPDFTWFRLPAPQAPERAPAPTFTEPVVVDAFGADGLYADQALIYAVDPGAQQLRQYHYQLWTDPPTRMLQRRLIAEMREARLSDEVTDELPASAKAVRLRGTVLRFDRVPTASGGWQAVVALKLRADGTDGHPLIDEYYRIEQAATGSDLKATVEAYGVALDTLFTRFHRDLLQREVAAHAH